MGKLYMYLAKRALQNEGDANDNNENVYQRMAACPAARD